MKTIHARAWSVRIVVFAAMVFGIIGCDDGPDPPPPKPINIVVILDTSDRVAEDKHPGQVKKDIEVCQNIVNYYHEHCRRQLFFVGNRLTFIVPNQPGIVPPPLHITKKLRIWPTRQDLGKGPKWFGAKRKEVLSSIEQLYGAIKTQNQFSGSDIWDWFRLHADGYLKKDMRNYIICVSDGYLDFDKSIQENRLRIGNKTSYMPYSVIAELSADPDWRKVYDTKGHGLLEVGQDFTGYDAKFLMVEMVLRDMRDNVEIIEHYWQGWLSSMGITQSEFVYSGGDSIGKIEESISQSESQDIKPIHKTHQ